ncbi:MAG TPA: heparinase II/III family protein, partial [Armatimonadota bacterium]
MKCFRPMICLLLIMLYPAYACALPGTNIPTKHPYLLYDAKAVETARARISTSPQARRIADDFLAQADRMMKEPVLLPAKGDTAHAGLSERAKTLGLAYLLSSDRKYAERAREIILMYADAYNNFPLTNLRCRVMSQSPLAEAEWFIPLVLAYDEVADSGVFTLKEKEHIERDLLRSAVKQFMIEDYASDPRVQDLHYRCYNFQAFHICAVGLVGLCLRDDKMISFAVDGPYGFKHLISHDLRDDGLFWERSLGYHSFVISALLPFTESAYHCGIDLYLLQVPDNITKDEDSNYVMDGDNGPKSLRMMFDAPFYFTFPDMSYACVADSGRGPLAADWMYKLAYHRYRDPKYAWLVRPQTRTDTDTGRVGFLHYYRHSYTYEKVRVSTDGVKWKSPIWDRTDADYKVSNGLVRADDGGVSGPDSYIWTKPDFRDFVLEWDMTREADSGSLDRAIVVWHIWPVNPASRKSFFLADYCPEIGKTYHFRLEVQGKTARLLRDGNLVSVSPQVYEANGGNYHDLFYDVPGPNEGRFGFDSGVTSFANNGVVQDGSSLFPSSGYATLRRPPAAKSGLPDSSSLALNFNCGPYGGGHGHPDKLSIVLYAGGHQWLPDFGSCGYDSPLKGSWTAQTVSHNTVVVDGVSQYPAGPDNRVWPTDTAQKRSVGRIDLFHANPVMSIAGGWTDSVYPGVYMKRTLANLGGSILDVFSIKSSEKHVYDYVLHVDGVLKGSSASLA